jgi:hypothetical protein
MKSVLSKNTSVAQDGTACTVDIIDTIFARIEGLRDAKTTKQMKQRALVDLFKCLKDQGYSSMKWSVPSQIRDSHQLLQLPVPLISTISDSYLGTRAALEKGESYFHRCQVEISRIRFEISMLGSQYMTQREMTLMQGYCDHMLFLLCQERSMLADMVQEISGVESFFECYQGISDSIPLAQDRLLSDTARFESALALSIEGLHQILLLLKEVSSLVVGDDRNKVRDAITVLTGCALTMKQSYSPCAGGKVISYDRVEAIREMTGVLKEVKTSVASCAGACRDVLPVRIFESSLDNIDQALEYSTSFAPQKEQTSSPSSNISEVGSALQAISALVQCALISAQSVATKTVESKNEHDTDSTVCSSHTKMVNEWDGLQLCKLHENLHELSRALLSLHGDDPPNEHIRSLCTRSAINSFSIVQKVLQLCKGRLHDTAVFYCQHSKLLYVLLRVFRVLIAKGFCSDDVSDGGEGDGEGGAGEMKFEDDVEGTGMGELFRVFTGPGAWQRLRSLTTLDLYLHPCLWRKPLDLR